LKRKEKRQFILDKMAEIEAKAFQINLSIEQNKGMTMTETVEKRFNIEGVPPSAERIEGWREEAKSEIKEIKTRENHGEVFWMIGLGILVYTFPIIFLTDASLFVCILSFVGCLFFLSGWLLTILNDDISYHKIILEELKEISADSIIELEDSSRNYPSVADYVKKIIPQGRKPVVAEYNMILCYGEQKDKEKKEQAKLKAAEEVLQRIESMEIATE